jgi:hypothetical protein
MVMMVAMMDVMVSGDGRDGYMVMVLVMMVAMMEVMVMIVMVIW